MNNTEEIRKEYADQVQKLLNEQSSDLWEFQTLWKSNKSREAYLFVCELICKNGLELTSEFKKADENFYWLFVN